MKKITFISIFLIAAFYYPKGQIDSLPAPQLKLKHYRVTLTTSSGEVKNGWHYYMSEAQLSLEHRHGKKARSFFPREPLSAVPSDIFSAVQIRNAKIKRNKSVLPGLVIGAATGLLAGVITGLASGDDSVDNYSIIAFPATAEQKAIILGILGMAAGSKIGALIGILVHKKFIINGGGRKSDTMQENVLDMTFGKNLD